MWILTKRPSALKSGKPKTMKAGQLFCKAQIKRLLTIISIKSLVVEVLGALVISRCLILLVPEGGIEPPRTQGPLDFEDCFSPDILLTIPIT